MTEDDLWRRLKFRLEKGQTEADRPRQTNRCPRTGSESADAQTLTATPPTKIRRKR